MTDEARSAVLRRAAERAASRPYFVSHDLDIYRSFSRFTVDEVAAELGCPPEQLPRLALCCRPETEGADFRQEVERIATYAGADPLRLVQLLRTVEAWQSLRGCERSASGATGLLLAARDREREGIETGQEPHALEPGETGIERESPIDDR